MVYSAALGGGKVNGTFTAQLYYDPTANANIAASVNSLEAADLTGAASPTSFGLTAASGAGSTAPFYTSPSLFGYFSAGASFLIQPGALSPLQGSYTIVVVAYNGSSYDTSTIRGYSSAVYITDASPDVDQGGDISTFFPQGTSMAYQPMITVDPVPEPTTMALGALGGLGLLLFRRKQV